jgi:hypothetical protein
MTGPLSFRGCPANQMQRREHPASVRLLRKDGQASHCVRHAVVCPDVDTLQYANTLDMDTPPVRKGCPRCAHFAPRWRKLIKPERHRWSLDPLPRASCSVTGIPGVCERSEKPLRVSENERLRRRPNTESLPTRRAMGWKTPGSAMMSGFRAAVCRFRPRLRARCGRSTMTWRRAPLP